MNREASAAVLLLTELMAPVVETHVCLRSGTRWIGRLQRIEPSPVGPQESAAVQISADGAYLISGGMRGLGLEVAKWLAASGAGEVILLGRTEPDEEAKSALADDMAAGTRVTCWAVDVSDRELLTSRVARRGDGALPIRGVVHAAGVIDDGLISGQSLHRLHAVLRPKVHGTINLAQIADDAGSDFFLIFSSATSVLGAGGQVTYAAANAFIDGLVQSRRAQGLVGHAVNWGPWADVGMASRLSGRDVRRLRVAGIERIGVTHGLEILSRLLRKPMGNTAVLPIDWAKYLAVPGHAMLASYLSVLQRSTQNKTDLSDQHSLAVAFVDTLSGLSCSRTRATNA